MVKSPVLVDYLILIPSGEQSNPISNEELWGTNGLSPKNLKLIFEQYKLRASSSHQCKKKIGFCFPPYMPAIWLQKALRSVVAYKSNPLSHLRCCHLTDNRASHDANVVAVH